MQDTCPACFLVVMFERASRSFAKTGSRVRTVRYTRPWPRQAGWADDGKRCEMQSHAGCTLVCGSLYIYL